MVATYPICLALCHRAIIPLAYTKLQRKQFLKSVLKFRVTTEVKPAEVDMMA